MHARLFAQLKASERLFVDETTAPVLDPGRGQTKTGQLFVYARDDRPWGGLDPPGVAYLYAPDRKAEHFIRHLAGFVGTLLICPHRSVPPFGTAFEPGGRIDVEEAPQA